jgi:acylphosphatase
MDNQARAHLLISGRVQGVFFRSETRDKAKAMGISGWVRNTSDGRVEAVFAGDRDNVEEIIQWCRKGPPTARVQDVDVDWEEFRGEFGSFSIRH